MDPVAEASTSNGLGYTGALADVKGKAAKGADELEIRIEFGYVAPYTHRS